MVCICRCVYVVSVYGMCVYEVCVCSRMSVCVCEVCVLCMWYICVKCVCICVRCVVCMMRVLRERVRGEKSVNSEQRVSSSSATENHRGFLLGSPESHVPRDGNSFQPSKVPSSCLVLWGS